MIRRRFIAYFALLAIVTCIATVAAEYHSLDASIEHSVRQNLNFTRSVARFVDGLLIEEAERLEGLIAALPEDATPDVASLNKWLARERKTHIDAAGLELYDDHHRALSAVNHPGGAAPPQVLLPALRKAESGTKLVVTDLWKGVDGKPRVTVVVNRPWGSSRLAAVANLRLDGEQFARLFGYFKVHGTARLQLLDSTGVALYSTNPRERYRSVVHGTYFSDRVRPGEAVQMRCHSCHIEGDERQVREREVTTVAPVDETGWAVTIREDESELFAPMRESLVARAILISVMIGSFMGFFVLLWRRVLLPMRQLARAATLAIAPSGHEAGVRLESDDEFVRLARSLDAVQASERRARRPLMTESGQHTAVDLSGGGRVATAGRRPDSGSHPLDGEAKIDQVGDLERLLERSLDDVISALARLDSVRSAMLCIGGEAIHRTVIVSHGIRLCESTAPDLLYKAGAERSLISLEPLARAGIRFEGGAGTKAFVVRRFGLGDSLEGQLWVGLEDASERTQQYVDPMVGLFAAQIFAVAERTLLYHQLESRHQQKNRLLRYLFDAEARERKRIAREIHDETAQDLAALLLMLETFPIPGDQDKQQAKLDKAKGQVGVILDGIDRLILRLRPAVLDDLGLIEAVRTFGHNLFTPAGIAFEFDVRGFDDSLPDEVESATYRVLQESATNVLRHSEATRVVVELHIGQDSLRASFRDNGKGMDLSWLQDTERQPRWGLLGMRERVIQLGGTIRFETPEDGGVMIAFEIPIERGPDEDEDLEERLEDPQPPAGDDDEA